MKQSLRTLLTIVVVFFVAFAVVPTPAYAVDCEDILIGVQSPRGTFDSDEANNLTVEVGGGLQAGGTYTLRGTVIAGQASRSYELATATATSNGAAAFTFNHNEAVDAGGYDINITPTIQGPGITTCNLPTYQVNNDINCSGSNITIRQDRNGQECFAREGVSGSCLQAGVPIVFKAEGIIQGGSLMNAPSGVVRQLLDFDNGTGGPNSATHQTPVTNGETDSWVFANVPTQASTFNAIIELDQAVINPDYCTAQLSFVANCNDVCLEEDALPEPGEDPESVPFALCNQIPQGSTARTECQNCVDDEDGVWTAIGCISREPQDILTALLSTGLTIGGGIALLMILGAGFIFSTSSGDPKRVDQAKELITSAIVGLIFIIFSVTILEFIGFTVLKIPGFGG